MTVSNADEIPKRDVAEGHTTLHGRTVPQPPPEGSRRKQIFDEAARLFLQRGYDGTSLQEIADAVGILKGSLYHYIGTKEDLLYAIVYENQARVIAIIDDLQQLDAGPVEKIEQFIRRTIAHNTQHHTVASVYQKDFQSLRGERRERVVAERDRYERYLRDLIVASQREGYFRPDLDAKLSGMAVLSLLNYLHIWYRADGASSPDEVADEFISLLMHGLEQPPTS
jgi:TetR/AcrR family transcriptional regulator, cholesterol catabolism regulator